MSKKNQSSEPKQDDALSPNTGVGPGPNDKAQMTDAELAGQEGMSKETKEDISSQKTEEKQKEKEKPKDEAPIPPPPAPPAQETQIESEVVTSPEVSRIEKSPSPETENKGNTLRQTVDSVQPELGTNEPSTSEGGVSYEADLASKIKNSGHAKVLVAHKDFVKMNAAGLIDWENKKLKGTGQQLVIDDNPDCPLGTYWEIKD